MVKYASMVACFARFEQSVICGAIIPAPFVIAPIVTFLSPISKETAMRFSTVSVVIIARAASWLPDRERESTAIVMPLRIISIGRNSPITPVEETSTSSGETPSASAV